MTTENTFLQCVREGNWSAAQLLVDQGVVTSADGPPGAPFFTWLIENNSPSQLIVSQLEHSIASGAEDPNRLGLLEICMKVSNVNSHAFQTFCSLLELGLSPNVIVAESGSTLLQKAMELNRTREVSQLLLHGADPNQMSVFGMESTSNLAEALAIGNAASELALATFNKREPSLS